MSFVDEASITVISGRGGDGAATFHREKFVPRGGPNGSDGGRGGDVLLVADSHLRTLYDFRMNREYKAKRGEDARANKKGRDGENLEIRVPVGTLIYDEETGELLADLSVDNMSVIAARGGRGGLGNLHFTSSVRQAPNFALKGEQSEERALRMELRLIADIGLVGLPNAGKSTLLSSISRAKPKIGAYPFTTISPNLGIATVGEQSFAVADLPGLIEGASEGHGLGLQFLKHAARTKALVHVVDAFPVDETNPWDNFQLIETELAKYDSELADKPRLVVLNKIDLDFEGAIEKVALPFREAGHRVFVLSGVSGEGVQEFLYACAEIVQKVDEEAPPVVLRPQPVKPKQEEWRVEKDEDGFRVEGDPVLRIAHRADFSSHEGLRFFHRSLVRAGVIEALRKAGATDGDTIRIGDTEFTFTDWE